MALGTLVKTLQNIMRKDAGINGDAQRIEQMTWMFFLKVYDAKEEEWEFHDDSYESVIPEELRWRSWAVDSKDGKALTGPELLDFVNNRLFPGLAGLDLPEGAPLSQVIVRQAFTDANNYMKDGVLLRQVVNAIDDAVDFTEYKERHAFGEIYETILKDLQSAGNAGEFYTPRAVTDFMAKMLDPKLGESVADFACGTGSFLTSALKLLEAQVETPADREVYSQSVYGMEKKQLPYLLCVTNMLLHDIDQPKIFHGNSLDRDVREYRHEPDGLFDVVLMNPPYGGSENDAIKNNFPVALRSSETADLFLALILYRLKEHGRAAVIIPDGFLFGADGAKLEIKRPPAGRGKPAHRRAHAPERVRPLHQHHHQHPVLRERQALRGRVVLPHGHARGLHALLEDQAIRLEHFDPVIEWWNNRRGNRRGRPPQGAFLHSRGAEGRRLQLRLVRLPA
jgi:type I restriction enzyme M protein